MIQFNVAYIYSGNVASSNDATTSWTFPISFTEIAMAMEVVNISAFTSATTTTSVSNATFSHSNKNKTSSSNFTWVHRIAIGF